MILIVDDHLEIGSALCRLLARQGFATTHVSSGKESLSLITAFDPEQPLLVILDDMMPGMSGLELLGVLRMNPTTRQFPVVMFSAGCDTQRRESARSLGILEWVIKSHDAIATLNAFIDHYVRIGGKKMPITKQTLSPQSPEAYAS